MGWYNHYCTLGDEALYTLACYLYEVFMVRKVHFNLYMSKIIRIFARYFSIFAMRVHVRTYWFMVILLLLVGGGAGVYAQQSRYLMEIGPVGGCGYYLGDAAEHIFMHPREAYGAQLRYKIAPRWAMQVKGVTQRITGDNYNMHGVKLDAPWQNQLINVDVVAEYNFFRLGNVSYDARIKPFSPYMFLGLGVSLYGREAQNGAEGKMRYDRVMGYLPLGIGLKWQMSKHFGLNLAWQHNIYFSDDIEGVDALNNTHGLNGSNWLNCDATGQLMLGLVLHFGRVKPVCRTCEF